MTAAAASLVLLALVGVFAFRAFFNDDAEPARFAYIDAEEYDVWVTDGGLTDRMRIFDSGPAKAFDLSWSPTGRHLSVTVDTGSFDLRVVHVLTADGQVVHQSQDSGFVAWSPNGEMFALLKPDQPHEYAADSVLDIRNLNGQTVCEFNLVFYGNFSADGRQFVHRALSDGAGSEAELRVADLARCSTHTVEALDDDRSNCFMPFFSPTDPSFVACGDQLYDLSSGTRQGLPGNFVNWSPDGRYLLLAQHGQRQRNCASDICTIPKGDCPPARLYEVTTTSETFEIAIGGSGVLGGCVSGAKDLSGWSPDAQRLVLSPTSEEDAKTLQIWSIDTRTSKTISIPEHEQWTGAFDPEVSPDGNRVLFKTSYTVGAVWFMADVDALTLEPLPGVLAPVWQPQTE